MFPLCIIARQSMQPNKLGSRWYGMLITRSLFFYLYFCSNKLFINQPLIAIFLLIQEGEISSGLKYLLNKNIYGTEISTEQKYILLN